MCGWVMIRRSAPFSSKLQQSHQTSSKKNVSSCRLMTNPRPALPASLRRGDVSHWDTRPHERFSHATLGDARDVGVVFTCKAPHESCVHGRYRDTTAVPVGHRISLRR